MTACPQSTEVNQTEFPKSEVARNDLLLILGVWFVLCVALFSLAHKNLSEPGGYYDEENYGGLAKNFLAGGEPRGTHFNGLDGFTYAIPLFNRSFPVFVAPYMGALKSWILMLTFIVFGPSLAVIRLTSLGCGLAALLFFMLWVHRWLGRNVALIFGITLALDPSFLFGNLLDWGSISPGLLCRAGCFCFLWVWWKNPRHVFAFLAGALAGLGFFHKVDVAIAFAGAGLAAACAYTRPLLARLAARRWSPLVALVGFIIPASPMLAKLRQVFTQSMHAGQTDLAEKAGTLSALYDGSYFYRLIDFGGMFPRIYGGHAPIFVPLAILLTIAGGYLLVCVSRGRLAEPMRRAAIFLLLSTAFISLGILLTPGATRLHHAVLVWPFPHLVIALGLGLFSRQLAALVGLPRIARFLPFALSAIILLSQCVAIQKTQQLIRETGGRGWWSDSFDSFCKSVKDRKDLTIVSLDWGFNEQLMFETEGPTLLEPFWYFPTGLPANSIRPTNCVFLLHPANYTFYPYGAEFLKAAQAQGTDVDIHPYYDRQNQIAFYAIRYLGR